MNGFGTLKFTKKGLELKTKSEFNKELQLVKFKIGDGALNGKDIKELEDLVSTKIDNIYINSKKVKTPNQIEIRAYIDNTTLEEGFFWREIGLYAKDIETGEDILYMYGNAEEFTNYIPSKEVLEAQANIDKILECSEESKKIINAKNQIKFITDRNNWDKIHLMSKEDLIARLNVEKTNSNVKVEDTKSQESEESKTDGKNKDEQIKKEILLKEEGREEAPVVSNVNEEENKGEIRDLVVIKHSAWEKTKGLLTKLSEKSKEIKKKQDKYLKRYVENYKKLNEGQEPSDFNKWVAKHCRYMSKKVNEVINYRKPINPEDYKGTQAEKLAEIVGINSKKLKKLKDRIIHENEQEGEDYEKTQAKELAEKVAVSKMIGENPWDRTSSYMEKMLIGQIIDHEEELRTIDEYYQNRNTAKAAGWEVKEHGDEVQDESRKVEEMQSPKDSKTRR